MAAARLAEAASRAALARPRWPTPPARRLPLTPATVAAAAGAFRLRAAMSFARHRLRLPDRRHPSSLMLGTGCPCPARPHGYPKTRIGARKDAVPAHHELAAGQPPRISGHCCGPSPEWNAGGSLARFRHLSESTASSWPRSASRRGTRERRSMRSSAACPEDPGEGGNDQRDETSRHAASAFWLVLGGGSGI
jgi:hypothetical protein